MKARILLCQRLEKRLCGLILVTCFVFLSDAASLKGKRMDFQGKCDQYLSVAHPIPKLLRLTVCVDLSLKDPNLKTWMAFSYTTKNTSLVTEEKELGLGGEYSQLRVHILGKTIPVNHSLSLFKWHHVCLIWDGAKGSLELFLNKTRLLVVMDNSQNMTANGDLVLGRFHCNEESQPDSRAHGTVGSLYHFQLWNRILENEDFQKCYKGNVVSWEEDHWFLNHMSPTTDDQLHCFTPGNVTVEGRSTPASQLSATPFSARPIITTPPGNTSSLVSALQTTDLSSSPVNRPSFSTTAVSNIPSIMLTEPPAATIQSSSILPNWGNTSPGPKAPLTLMSSTPAEATAMTTLSETTLRGSTLTFLSTGMASSSAAAQPTVSFYDTKMRFSVSDKESTIFVQNWLKLLFQDSEFVLTNLTVKMKGRNKFQEIGRMKQSRSLEQRSPKMMVARPSGYVCQAIIKAHSSAVPADLITRIKMKILGNHTQGHMTLTVKPEDVEVKKLEPGKCAEEETTSRYKGTYKWPLTNPTETAQSRCVKNPSRNATRICTIEAENGKASWGILCYKACNLLQPLPDKIVDLEDILITDENADDVAKHILSLIHGSPSLNQKEIKIIVSKVSDISKCDELSLNLAQVLFQILDVVLGIGSLPGQPSLSNEILRTIERVGYKMEFSGKTANVTVASLALAVLQVDEEFEGISFSIHYYKEGVGPKVYLDNTPQRMTLASIYLPKSLKKRIPFDLQKILFSFFGQTSVFKRHISQNENLTTYVVSASAANTSIRNLADPIEFTLQHIKGNTKRARVQCVFWDFEKNDGLGGWNSSGCEVNKTDVNYTICQCNHLTHFGVLMDLSRSEVDKINEQILTIITYSGCGISSLFLGIALVTYLAFQKLRQDYPAKILINLCISLLMLNLSFLANSWFAAFENSSLCISMAVLLHYFLISSFTWMGLEAVHMYFALVRVFNIYVKNYLLKFCVVGWGLPAVIIGIILIMKRDFYGILKESTSFCWIQDDLAFYISIVAYFCLIFLINVSMFILVLFQINSLQCQKQRVWKKLILHDLKSTASLTFLLGLTWGLAFFAWGPMRIPFLYLFALLNTTQGFFIFVFHCLLKENVRKQWQEHLCCGRFRLNNYSDGNSRSGLNCEHKQDGTQKNCENVLVTQTQECTKAWNPPLSTFRGFERRHDLVMTFENEVCCDISSSPKHCGEQDLASGRSGFESCLRIY
ncbi:adhesion G-protein coupled receptor G4 [Dromiciops gliroides]|uniref:adhesion G-protein coupled receptor G4 n=1 Tax=Dromiciops gliroides TaxID=33562 RepID=UPI001CC461A2|nr:adhesion G-protein coupled receptor G4 [Dromiciops gliroides]